MSDFFIIDPQSVQTDLLAKFFHALSNPTRFRIIEKLLEGEKNVGSLVESLEISQSQASNQLACLKACGYVSSRQEGKNVFYQIKDERIRIILELGKQVVADNAASINACTRF